MYSLCIYVLYIIKCDRCKKGVSFPSLLLLIHFLFPYMYIYITSKIYKRRSVSLYCKREIERETERRLTNIRFSTMKSFHLICCTVLFFICLSRSTIVVRGNNNTNVTKKQQIRDNSNFGKPVYGEKYVKEEHIFHHFNNGAKSVLKYEVEHHDNVIHFRLKKYGVAQVLSIAVKIFLLFAKIL